MPTIPEQAHAELQALYQRLDEALRPFRRVCEASGRCCHFSGGGPMLFVTGLEAAEMRRSGVSLDFAQLAAGACPFLRGKACGIRAHRALGCRLYYCDRTHEEERHALYERFLREIRALETRHGIEPRYAPVTQLFAEPAPTAPREPAP